MLQRLILEDLYLDLEFLHSSILYKRNSYCDWLQWRAPDFFQIGQITFLGGGDFCTWGLTHRGGVDCMIKT